ncbi:hypothetical protein GGX14DRAFT_643920 [Mycena pura]|uniref:Uncharacterized protein n=1 Tax=Mycena pura TaxID=153505 RepID=A0AAD6VCR3_9AGAR|nr:hypothetical protein GGX14DRAFT_667695 [Mycena pura]KAJ7206009.1 hypothetical protein GGX14DRAFT_643920 [Mycena pura]
MFGGKYPEATSPHPSNQKRMRVPLFLVSALAYATRVHAYAFPDCVAGPLANTIVCDPPAARASALIAMFTPTTLSGG